MANDGVNERPPTDVLRMWRDVTDGLVKHKTVVWTEAVKSLNYAQQYILISTDARTFTNNFMAQIVSILLDQYPEIIDPKDKECIEKVMYCSLEIIKDDLTMREECATLEALVTVFDDKKNVQLKGKLISYFRRVHGFTILGAYMSSRVSNLKFPEMNMVNTLLEVVLESIPGPDNQERRGDDQKLHCIRDEALQISSAIMNHVISLDEGNLAQIDLDLIRQIRWQLFRIHLRLSDSNHRLMTSFFIFWRSLALKSITSKGLPMKLFGWSEIVSIVKDSQNLCLNPPRSYIVSGAGTESINGRYDFDPKGKVMENGLLKPSVEPVYHKRIHANDSNNEWVGRTLTLFKCTMRSLKTKWWFLSEANPKQPGTERDIDYYEHKSKPNEEELPPSAGWLTMNAGAEPSPILEPISLKVPDGEDNDILEEQLARWAIDNEVIELVFAEPIKSDIVAKSTELIKFLAERICVRVNASHLLKGTSTQLSKDVTILNQFFLEAWKTCSDTSDAELSAQIYNLLVCVVPTLSDEMAISLFGAIRDSLVLSDKKCKNDYVSGFCRNIDVLTDINQSNTALVEMARQIKMMAS